MLQKFRNCNQHLLAEFVLETENCLSRETRLKTENLSVMNAVKDEFPASNLTVYILV